MKRTALLLFAGALALAAQSSTPAAGPGFSKMVADAKTRIKEVDVASYQKMASSSEKPVLIDVREDSEWAAGHAASAQHLSKGTIERDIESKVPDKSAKIVLYCGGGSRSALAADSLQKMGYTNVYSLSGGFKAYKDAGLPATK